MGWGGEGNNTTCNVDYGALLWLLVVTCIVVVVYCFPRKTCSFYVLLLDEMSVGEGKMF